MLPVRIALLVWLLSLPLAATTHGQAPSEPAALPRATATGAELFGAACAACHGTDGTGVSQSVTGFEMPLPDFSDCAFGTVEPDTDWLAVSHDGGPARGFDRRMPAFGELLTEAELGRTLDYIRGFCTNGSWPRGDLNLPRPLVTEKAFPENELVVTTLVGTATDSSVTNEILYEKRFGPRNQIEVAVPLALKESAAGMWSRGLGDVAVALKRAAYHNLARGTIVSVVGEAVLPTGKETLGLGKGMTVFEPFVTAGQLLPRNAFVQAQAGAELPADRDKATPEAFWRAVIGTTIEQGRFGRSWSPMIELLGARELEHGEPTQWDVVPQMQITLNRRQHIMINAGVRLPLTARDERHAQVITYFLWDWFDGGLREGW